MWLHGAPINSNSYEESVSKNGSSFVRGLEEFVDSIVTTELPLQTDQVRCDRCNTRGAFVAMPIPGRARVSASKRSARDQLEPLLVKCGGCGQESSSQHIIRQTLLQHRPPHWPPPLRLLTREEKASRVAREVQARSTQAEALAAIENREMFETAIEADQREETANWILQASDSTQCGSVHADEDPVKLDLMHRLIEMTPPTLDRERMSPEHYAYMLASLVLNFNIHSWTHTTSCFKKSRATTKASACRYGFPRDRAESSCIGGSRVAIKRALAHEYINGYNPIIMTMFKCNHDVQILFGGKDVINRIYYCFKYVTKPQRQIDSTTAVALASFQRRQ
jgi:hypothetical protein